MNKIIKKFNIKNRNFLFVSNLIIMIIILSSSTLISSALNYNYLKSKDVNLVQDQNGFFHLIGILYNTGNKTINDIYITANFLNKNNFSIFNYSRQTEIQSLNPNESTPFDILVFDKDHNKDIKNYSLSSKYNFTNYNEKNLETISTKNRFDITGTYFIDGKLKNNGKNYLNNTTVIAAVYDDKNKLIGIWRAQTEPYSIPSSAIASFSIPVTDKTQSFKIKRYTLFFQ